jgi:threonine-phosphate decarboxylase
MPGHGDALARDFRGAVDDRQLASGLDRTHGGDVDAWAHDIGVEAGAIVDFSASINPLGPPPSARNAYVRSYDAVSRYPDPYGAKLKIALAERHGLKPTEVLLGNGSTQLIYLLCAALRPRRALIVGPAFSEYANALILGGAETHTLPFRAEDGFRLSMERLAASWSKNCAIVFLTTPNSVTGQLIPMTEIEAIAGAALKRKSFICVDEAFIDFTEEQSVTRLVHGNPYLIVLRSLTKYYALPGLRLGYLLGEARRVAQIADYAEPWSVNGPALNVALACLKDKHFVVKTQRWLATERSFLSRKLAAHPGLHPFPSQANFLLVKITRKRLDALQLRSLLARKGILIRACDSFAGLASEYFRIAVKRREDNLRLLAALKEVVGDDTPMAT